MIHFVTADGGESFDKSGAGSGAEAANIPLVCAECFIALRVLATGGTLVLRMSGLAERETHILLALLVPIFRHCELLVPDTVPLTDSVIYLAACDLLPPAAPLDETIRQVQRRAFTPATVLYQAPFMQDPLDGWSERCLAADAHIASLRAARLERASNLAYFMHSTGVSEATQPSRDVMSELLRDPAQLCRLIVP